MIRKRRGVLYVAVLAAVAAPLLLWAVAQLTPTPRTALALPVTQVSRNSDTKSLVASNQDTADLIKLAAADPLALVRLGHERHDRDIKDYRCVLTKQERVNGELSAVQKVDVRFRNEPRAVYMFWRENAGDAKRALYKKDAPGYVDDNGEALVRVEPAGAIARLFVSDIFVQLHGERARAASRRTIDECGFDTLFHLMDQYCTTAKARNELSLKFVGTGEVDGRPTFVIERRLPYEGEGGRYPDAKMVLHMDQEWLLPVAVESYADPAGTQLLGKYVFTQIELNPGLTEADFTF